MKNQNPGIKIFKSNDLNSINLLISNFQRTVTGEKKSFRNAIRSVVLDSKQRKCIVTVHHLQGAIYVPVIKV